MNLTENQTKKFKIAAEIISDNIDELKQDPSISVCEGDSIRKKIALAELIGKPYTTLDAVSRQGCHAAVAHPIK